METNKFEKLMAKRLEEREIEPSFEAWDKIEEQLGHSEKASRKRYFWYAVAASFIGLLGISILFQKDDTPDNGPENKIVNAPNYDFNQTTKKGDLLNVKEGKLTFEPKEVPSKKTRGSHNPNPKEWKLATPDLSEKLGSEAKIAQNLKEPQKEELAGERKTAMDEKIAEVLAKVNSLESADNVALSNGEVDSLLRNAQQELLTNKIFNDNRPVDAMALLNEVEEELDQTFRSQIFETLKNGFLRARTAVADRNN